MAETAAPAMEMDERDMKPASVQANNRLDVGQIIQLSVSKDEERKVLRKIDMMCVISAVVERAIRMAAILTMNSIVSYLSWP